ncbi:MAG: prepilin-type N-terminal cleavage/methylation domain-containing protein [Candidatus Paceibacteria bacterium]|jgi:prepilin-type N-terminal cleavage/methylation domain-containing protein
MINKKGFTLIELLVVIAIIGLLSSVVLASLNTARARGNDAKRLSEMRSIMTALELYYNDNGRYPNSDYAGCGGWDVGNQADPLWNTGAMDDYISADLRDEIGSDNCSGYRYYRYNAGSYGCGSLSPEAFYVLGVTDMESSGRPHPNSPGWSCPSRNWQGEMDWVTGSFE